MKENGQKACEEGHKGDGWLEPESQANRSISGAAEVRNGGGNGGGVRVGACPPRWVKLASLKRVGLFVSARA